LFLKNSLEKLKISWHAMPEEVQHVLTGCYNNFKNDPAVMAEKVLP
jgi:hypothetical protein